MHSGYAWGWKAIISFRDDIISTVGSVDATHESFQSAKYHVSKWYEFSKPTSTKFYWWKVVCRSWPWERQKFILWLAARNSLAIGVMLKERGMNAPDERVFCALARGDSCNHLFFKYAFTNDVWAST